jgi:hypothetical protein
LTADEMKSRMQDFQWYHTIDLGEGIVTPGQYDLQPLLRHYGIPESVAGKSVLDVGPGHGFFSFEFERRGAASVTTVELPSWTEHDVSPAMRSEFERGECGKSWAPTCMARSASRFRRGSRKSSGALQRAISRPRTSAP